MRDTKWESDYMFLRIADLLWPELTELATAYGRPKGHAQARRTMDERYRGFRAFLGLATRADDIAKLRADIARRVS